MAGVEVILQDDSLVLWVKSGIVLWSLLCVMVTMRNGGKMLENFAMMLVCQFFLIMVGLFIVTAIEAILPRMIGMAIFAFAIISSIMRRENFLYARYCILAGALLATCTLLLF